MCAIIIKYDEVFGNSDKIWDIDENGELRGYNGKGGAIAIPDGVKAVAKGAFRWNNAVTSVTLPQSLTAIGRMAFFSCSALEYVYLTDNVSEIGESAFEHCSELKKVVTVKENDALLKSEEHLSGEVGKYAFSSCENLVSAELSRGIKRIAPNAFEMCIKLNRINLPPFLESIGDMAFFECRSLKKIAFTDTLKDIGQLAFRYAALQTAYLPDSVISVGAEAFRANAGLTSVSLPASLTTLPAGLLYGCSSLKKIVYRGTEEMWEKVEKHEKWAPDNPGTVIRFCPE